MRYTLLYIYFRLFIISLSLLSSFCFADILFKNRSGEALWIKIISTGCATKTFSIAPKKTHQIEIDPEIPCFVKNIHINTEEPEEDNYAITVPLYGQHIKATSHKVLIFTIKKDRRGRFALKIG